MRSTAQTGQVEAYTARATVMAAGGAGRCYLFSTAPRGATGDGIAMAWRAGARVSNMEMMQFHPTCLYNLEVKNFLITEAVRGEGGRLINPRHRRSATWPDYDERVELAPRDIVARANDDQIKRYGLDYVHLDISHQPPEFVKEHFPTIHEKLLGLGIDMTKEPIPVVPGAALHLRRGAHRARRADRPAGPVGSGRMHRERAARRQPPGLELAARMLRLRRGGGDATSSTAGTSSTTSPAIREWDESRVTNSDEEVVIKQNWTEIRRFMWNYVGIVRTTKRLERAAHRIKLLHERDRRLLRPLPRDDRPDRAQEPAAMRRPDRAQRAEAPRKPRAALHARLSRDRGRGARYRAGPVILLATAKSGATLLESHSGAASVADLGLSLLAAVVVGLLIGIERGWRQRGEVEGMRVAGIRTFTLIGAIGGIIGVLALTVSMVIAAVLLAGALALLVGAFLRGRTQEEKRDATTMVAALLTLCLGLLAGAGYDALAMAAAAVATFVLAIRRQAHGFLDALSEQELRAIARYAIISIAVLPLLPDANYGPYDAWNPFRLWLVVVLVTGFSVAAYVANRLVGQKRGTITMAIIGGAYSSTAVTAAFAGRLKEAHTGPFATGIALASAVMYVRVMLLALILAPRVALALAELLAIPAFVAFAVAAFVWRTDRGTATTATELSRRPFELLPAFTFLAAVAAASLLVRWAQVEYGETGGALSLFLAGSFDVDAALVAYSTLPVDSVLPPLAALALAGTVAVNMAFKAAIVFVNAGLAAGRRAGMALVASLAVLIAILVWTFVASFG